MSDVYNLRGGSICDRCVCESIVAIAKAIDLSNFPLKIAVSVEGGAEDFMKRGVRMEPRLVIRLRVMHRGDLHEIEVANAFQLNEPHLYYSEDEHLRWVRARIREMVLHELDECILIKGVRVFDPHGEPDERML